MSGQITKDGTTKVITKEIPIGAPFNRTQWSNTYEVQEVRTINTIDSGYTSSKNGWASANMPTPSGDIIEYISIAGTPRITNGACYSRATVERFRPNSRYGFGIRAHRDTGSSCGNPRFTASVDVLCSIRKQTDWYFSLALANAEHTGVTHTRTRTGTKHISSLIRDNDLKKVTLKK